MRLKWHGLWDRPGRGLGRWGGSRDALIQISRSLAGGGTAEGLHQSAHPGLLRLYAPLCQGPSNRKISLGLLMCGLEN